MGEGGGGFGEQQDLFSGYTQLERRFSRRGEDLWFHDQEFRFRGLQSVGEFVGGVAGVCADKYPAGADDALD